MRGLGPGLQITRVAAHPGRHGPSGIVAKTLRDGLPAALVVAALLGGLCLVGAWTMAASYGTPATRAELATLASSLPPVLRGLYGSPVRIDTLGGFISWHYGAYFALLGGLWSIVTLSGCLSREAERGSLDVLLAAPLGRRRIAIEVVGGHLVAVVLVVAITAVATWAGAAAWARFPGDPISPSAAAAFVAGIGATSLVAGAVAFAVAPILGRGPAMGIAGTWMMGGYVAWSYRTVIPAFDTVRHGSWFSWTAGHLPLAGLVDWPAVLATVGVAALLLAAGVEGFARRDAGATLAIAIPGPRPSAGTRGPTSRSFAEVLPVAAWWGVGLGAYGLLIAASTPAVMSVIRSSPELAGVVAGYLPSVDLSSAGGMLQFAFIDLGYVLVGLAAASLVANRAADEAEGRLELPLAAPVGRAAWAIATGTAVLLALVLTTSLLAISVALGVRMAGEAAAVPVAGIAAVGVYGAALAGIGCAVLGFAGPSWAGRTVAALAVTGGLLDLLGPALRLPDWVERLALTHHLGQPMLGTWGAAGVAACLALTVAGIALGAWGMRRRDILP